MGIDVGGTNTDAVILQDKQVLAWHKTPTTSDIQASVERAIQGVLKKANIPPGQVQSVKIGTTVRIINSLPFFSPKEMPFAAVSNSGLPIETQSR